MKDYIPKVAFRIRQKHNRQGTSKPIKLNTAKLSTISHRESFEQKMDSALAQWEEKESSTPDEEWTALQQVVYNTVKTYLGKPERKHQDWFDPKDQVDASNQKKFGLKINIKKTEVLYQPNSTKTREEDIMVDGNKLNSVLGFTYVGSTISSNGCFDNEIQRRMAKASASFG